MPARVAGATRASSRQRITATTATIAPRVRTRSSSRWRPSSSDEAMPSTISGAASSGLTSSHPNPARIHATWTSCGRSGRSSTARQPAEAEPGDRNSNIGNPVVQTLAGRVCRSLRMACLPPCSEAERLGDQDDGDPARAIMVDDQRLGEHASGKAGALHARVFPGQAVLAQAAQALIKVADQLLVADDEDDLAGGIGVGA